MKYKRNTGSQYQRRSGIENTRSTSSASSSIEAAVMWQEINMIRERRMIEERDLESDDAIKWISINGEKNVSTLNLVKGNNVYGEKLVKYEGEEYRIWDPFRSKLAAALKKGMKNMPIKIGSKVLYLGASTGTTVSHISDIVGLSGLVFEIRRYNDVGSQDKEHRCDNGSTSGSGTGGN